MSVWHLAQALVRDFDASSFVYRTKVVTWCDESSEVLPVEDSIVFEPWAAKCEKCLLARTEAQQKAGKS